MNQKAMSKLRELKGTLATQRDFYRNMLTDNWKAQADNNRQFSLSFLEGQAKAYHQALLRAERALRYLDDAIKEAENA